MQLVDCNGKVISKLNCWMVRSMKGLMLCNFETIDWLLSSYAGPLYLVLPSGAYISGLDFQLLSILHIAGHKKKTVFLQCFGLPPPKTVHWTFFMAIAKLSITGNCSCLNSNDTLDGISGICGTKTTSPVALPVRTVTYKTLGIILLIVCHCKAWVGPGFLKASLMLQSWGASYEMEGLLVLQGYSEIRDSSQFHQTWA